MGSDHLCTCGPGEGCNKEAPMPAAGLTINIDQLNTSWAYWPLKQLEYAKREIDEALRKRKNLEKKRPGRKP